MNRLVYVFLAVLLASLSANVFADDEQLTVKEIAEKKEAEEKLLKELEKETEKKVSKDEYNRLTPRSAIVELSLALRDKDYERAQNYLDLRHLPFAEKQTVDGMDLSRKLGIIAGRAMTVSLETFSDDPRGYLDDGLPKYQDLIDTIDTPEGELAIYLQKVPGPDGLYVWKVSNQTVAKIPYLYDLYGYNEVAEKLAEIIPDYDMPVTGMKLWQIVMIIGMFIAAYLIALIVTYLMTVMLIGKSDERKRRLKRFFSGPLRFFILVFIVRYFFDEVSPSQTMKAVFEAGTLSLIATFWLLSGVVDLLMGRIGENMHRKGQPNSAVLLKPAATGIKLLLLIVATLIWMDGLGFKVTTVLAGLGVGSLALALAAQKSLENLIGSITIYAAQPVKVGDFCKFGETLGVVEEIGLRSTKIRTLARSLTDIPNAMFSTGKIENLTLRDKILYRTRIRLSYSVTPTQVRSVMAAIRAMLADNDSIDQDSSRIRFIEFGKYAQELEIYLYVKTTDYQVYLEQIEETNLKIMDIVELNEVKLAVPENITRFESTHDIAHPIKN